MEGTCSGSPECGWMKPFCEQLAGLFQAQDVVAVGNFELPGNCRDGNASDCRLFSEVLHVAARTKGGRKRKFCLVLTGAKGKNLQRI